MNTDNVTTTCANAAAPTFRPRLAFYHPNAKGTGGAVKFELHPAHDSVDGSIMMTLANQMTVGALRSATPVFPRFDWENRITVKLDFSDLSRMLMVFRGVCESIEDGRGLYHQTRDFATRIVLRHVLEPVQGYSLEVYRTIKSSGGEIRSRIFLNPWEAFGLTEAISGAMAIVSFGIPVVIPHIRAERETGSVRDEAAA